MLSLPEASNQDYFSTLQFAVHGYTNSCWNLYACFSPLILNTWICASFTRQTLLSRKAILLQVWCGKWTKSTCVNWFWVMRNVCETFFFCSVGERCYQSHARARGIYTDMQAVFPSSVLCSAMHGSVDVPGGHSKQVQWMRMCSGKETLTDYIPHNPPPPPALQLLNTPLNF